MVSRTIDDWLAKLDLEPDEDAADQGYECMACHTGMSLEANSEAYAPFVCNHCAQEALPVLIAEITRLRKAASRRHAEYPDPPNPKVEKIRAALSEQNRKRKEEGK